MIPEDHAIDVEYDLIAIVDGLPQNERVRWQLAENLADHLAAKGVQNQTARCNSRVGIEDGLAHFVKRAREGTKFAMHFICHGNADGLGLKATREFIPWQELTEDLRKINDAMEGQLTVNMSSCQGLHGVEIISPSDGLPFFGLVGPKEKIGIETAERISKIYYDLQLDGMEVDEAVQQINKIEGRDLLCCVPARPYQHILRLQKRDGAGYSLSFEYP